MFGIKKLKKQQFNGFRNLDRRWTSIEVHFLILVSVSAVVGNLELKKKQFNDF